MSYRLALRTRHTRPGVPQVRYAPDTHVPACATRQQRSCSPGRTGKGVLRGGDGTGFGVIEQEVIEQREEVIEHTSGFT